MLSTGLRGDATTGTVSVSLNKALPTALPMLPGPTPLWGLRAVPGMWADVFGFLKPLDSNERWRVRQHGAFLVRPEALGIRQTDQSCHHEVWLHMDYVERQAHHERHRGRQRCADLTPSHKVHVERMFFLFCPYWFCLILSRARACHIHPPHQLHACQEMFESWI